MNNILIYQIRENQDLYYYLKYNSYIYKDIIRGNISIKTIEKKMKYEIKQTPIDKILNVSKKLEKINNLIEIFK